MQGKVSVRVGEFRLAVRRALSDNILRKDASSIVPSDELTCVTASG